MFSPRTCTVSALCALVALIGCTQAATPQAPSTAQAVAPSALAEPTLPVDAILRSAAQRYATCQSYQDSGTLHDTLRSQASEEPTRSTTSFRTAFVRQSGKFYFAYTTAPERFVAPSGAVIWRTAPGPARMWWSVEPNKLDEEELLGALLTQGGVSHGLTRLVPRWLVDDQGKTFTLPYRLAGDENVRGAPCFRVSAVEGEHAVTLWLRKSDYALVRFVSRKVIQPTSEPPISDAMRQSLTVEQLKSFLEYSKLPLVSEKTIDLEPAFDAALDEGVFGFSQPSKG